jgi:dTDP-glucose 4,6-dehydratase
MSFAKLRKLGWKPGVGMEQGLRETVNWYLENRTWWEEIKSLARFSRYYRKQYAHRGKVSSSQ